MLTRRITRFVCEYCRKGFWKKSSTLRHEKRCLRNPKRECGLCERNGIQQKTLEELVDLLDLGPETLAEQTCPMCALAACMEVNKQNGWGSRSEEAWSFDYQRAMKRFDEIHHPKEEEIPW